MKVILKEEISNVGSAGDVVQVSDGYARNYLFPYKKAMPATKNNVKNLEQYRKGIQKRKAKQKGHFEEVAKKLSEQTCVISKRAGKGNKLFGAVTSQDVYNSLLNQGFKLDKKSIHLESPIKETGNFEVTIRLHPEVKATVKVTVKAEA